MSDLNAASLLDQRLDTGMTSRPGVTLRDMITVYRNDESLYEFSLCDARLEGEDRSARVAEWCRTHCTGDFFIALGILWLVEDVDAVAYELSCPSIMRSGETAKLALA